jgi:hypothetical protein
MRTIYSLFYFDKEANGWECESTYDTRKEAQEYAQALYGKKKRILKHDANMPFVDVMAMLK